MEYRGPILLVFGASLILSPLAILRWQEAQTAAQGPQMIQTQTAAQAACDAQAIETQSYRLGCIQPPKQQATRRVMPGGAVFVSASR